MGPKFLVKTRAALTQGYPNPPLSDSRGFALRWAIVFEPKKRLEALGEKRKRKTVKIFLTSSLKIEFEEREKRWIYGSSL